jgi:transposase
MKDFLTAKEIEMLQECHHSARFRKSADRIKAILFLNEGFSYPQTAKLLMLDEISIRRYEKEYKGKGIDGLLENRYQGSNGFLDLSEEQEFTKHLREHTYQTVKEVVAYVVKTYSNRKTKCQI